MRLRVAIALTAMLSGTAVAVRSQESRGGIDATASVTGQVIDAATGQPVAAATIRAAVLAPPPGGPVGQRPPPMTTASDTEGRFHLANIPAGAVNLTASAPGYLTQTYRPTSSSQPLQLRPGERITGAVLRLERASALSGVVRDERGAPIPNLLVHVYRRGILTTRRVWSSIRRPVVTDDRGTYRTNELEPGEYVVAVPVLATTVPGSVVDAVRRAATDKNMAVLQAIEDSRAPLPGPAFRVQDAFAALSTGGLSMQLVPSPGPDPGGAARAFRTTYHPSANQLNDAAIVTLQGGESRGDVDIELKASPALRLSGVLRTISGDAAAYTGVHLFADHADERSIDLDVEAAVTVSDAAGAFTFLNVASGDYRLKVALMPAPAGKSLPVLPPSEVLTAWTERTVALKGANVDLGVIPLQRPLVIRGRHVFSGAGAANPLTNPSRLWTGAVEGGMHSPPVVTRTEPDGTFTMSGAMAGRYQLLGGGAPGWVVKAITVDGRDVTGEPIELVDRDVEVTIHVTSRPTLVSGVVRDAAGSPVADAHVVAFPADYLRWIRNGMSFRLVRSVRTRSDGVYSVGALPPGNYLLAAFPEDDMREWPDRRVIEAAGKAATRIDLPEGARVDADLSIGRLVSSIRK